MPDSGTDALELGEQIKFPRVSYKSIGEEEKKRILLVSSISEDVDDENIREYNNDDNLSIVGQ